MAPEVERRVQAALSAYRAWAGRALKPKARLVQYADDVTPPMGFDEPLGDVELQIEGLVGEGFQVGWAEHYGRVYLRIWEQTEPSWPEVFAEAPCSELCDPPDDEDAEPGAAPDTAI